MAISVSFSLGQNDDEVYRLVTTSSGTVRGRLDRRPDTPVTKFLGIPYAAPPVGSLRFKPPAPPRHWDGVRDALEAGNICTQQRYPAFLNETQPMGEDCLLLHVYVPEVNGTERLPVMLWLHEGGFVVGNGAMYDGTSLVCEIFSASFRLNTGTIIFHQNQ